MVKPFHHVVGREVRHYVVEGGLRRHVRAKSDRGWLANVSILC